MAARKARSSSLKAGPGGRMVSARSKTGDPACSQAMSMWVRARHGGAAVASEVFKILAGCRAKARGLAFSKAHAEQGNAIQAQVHAKRASRSMSDAARARKAAELRADRKSKITSKATSKAEGFQLHQEASQGKKATTFESSGGRTGTMFDMKRGDLRGQTSLFDRVGTVEARTSQRPFHEQVTEAAHAVPASGRSGNKVWIHHVYHEHQKNPSNPRMTAAEFKQRLADERGKLELSRADLVGDHAKGEIGHHPHDMQAAHTPVMMGGRQAAEFHFVKLSGEKRTVHMASHRGPERAREAKPLKPVAPAEVERRGRQDLERRSKLAAHIRKQRETKVEHAMPERHGKTGKTYEMATEHVHFDPERFQYKIAAQGSHGVTDALKGVKRYDPELAGTISVWKDPENGKTYVVNGHHRLDLAKKMGVKSVSVRYLDADNHVSARSKGALVNIAEGRGNSVDAAKFFRDRNITAEQAQDLGLPMKERIATEGLAMKGLNEGIFKRVVNHEMTPARAAIIGGSGLSHAQQDALMKSLDKPKFRNASDGTVRNLVDIAKHSETKKVTKTDLFGTTEEEESLALHRATLEDKIKRRLSADKKLFGIVSKSKAAESLAERGRSQIDLEATGAESEQAAGLLHLFDQQKHLAGPLNQSLNEGAERLHGREKSEKVVNEHYKKAVQHLKRILDNPSEAF